jgi:hypothetical protein
MLVVPGSNIGVTVHKAHTLTSTPHRRLLEPSHMAQGQKLMVLSERNHDLGHTVTHLHPGRKQRKSRGGVRRRERKSKKLGAKKRKRQRQRPKQSARQRLQRRN